MRAFTDRQDAGRRLAARVAQRLGPGIRGWVLGLPRGGVPVAAEIAKRLGWPLDVFVVRKLGVPGQEELAMGAVASGGLRVFNEGVVRTLRLEPAEIEAVTAREAAEVSRREQAYRGGRPAANPAGQTIVLADDGLATGASMRVAVAALRRAGAGRIIAAVPVAAEDAARLVAEEADDLVVGLTPPWFSSVGEWYDDFAEVTDDEVRSLLAAESGFTR